MANLDNVLREWIPPDDKPATSKWSPQQDEALKAVNRWLKNRDSPFFYLAGYAGTGKTTLAKYLAQDVNGLVQYGAFTGKAAHVMRQKGCFNAATIHSLIYKPNGGEDPVAAQLKAEIREAKKKGDPKAIEVAVKAYEFHCAGQNYKPSFRRKFYEELGGEDGGVPALFIIDECSMVGARLGDDLLSFDIPVLVLGDPGQLPPVADAGYFTNNEPDYMLTEVHRQAKDNPILNLATTVREGGNLDFGQYGTSRVIRKGQLERDDLYNCDQILVGLNRTRREYNTRYRRGIHGPDVTPYPVMRDRLVCLRNDHKVGLLNGAQYEVNQFYPMEDHEDFFDLDIEAIDDDLNLRVSAHKAIFDGKDMKDYPYSVRKEAQEFDYAYAMTVHKSQGSQWDNVVLFDESGSFRSDWKKWLYTGITRAAKSITIAQ